MLKHGQGIASIANSLVVRDVMMFLSLLVTQMVICASLYVVQLSLWSRLPTAFLRLFKFNHHIISDAIILYLFLLFAATAFILQAFYLTLWSGLAMRIIWWITGLDVISGGTWALIFHTALENLLEQYLLPLHYGKCLWVLHRLLECSFDFVRRFVASIVLVITILLHLFNQLIIIVVIFLSLEINDTFWRSL